MKLLIICILAIIISTEASEEDKQKLIAQYSKECIDVSKVDPQVLKDAHEKGIYPDDPKLKKHALCFGKKTGLVNEKGEFQEELVRKNLNAQTDKTEDVEKLIKLCLVNKATPEDTVYSGLVCFHKNAPKGVVLV